MSVNEQPLAETSDACGAFPRLGEEHIAVLSGCGRRWRTRAGEVLVREGQRDRDFFVVAGKVAVVEGLGTDEERVIRVHGPGRFLDELGLLTGQPSFVSSVVREPGEVLAVPVTALREQVAHDPRLGSWSVPGWRRCPSSGSAGCSPSGGGRRARTTSDGGSRSRRRIRTPTARKVTPA